MKKKIFRKIFFTTSIALSIHVTIEAYKQGFNSNEFYYFINGFYRGARSLKEGAKVVLNYKLVNNYIDIPLCLKNFIC